MGHTRLGKIPTTRKWNQVVTLFAEAGAGDSSTAVADDVTLISARALDAAQTALERAIDDAGLRYTFYLLIQLVLAAQSENWQKELSLFNIRLTDAASVFDLTAELQAAIDARVATTTHASDISEMVQQAAGEAIAALVGPYALTLFGNSHEDLRIAVRRLSTKRGFSELGQEFFGRFMSRFLNFYLSRATADLLGRSRLRQLGDIATFNRVLQTHCHQSALILRDFCGEWYSKTEFQQGIDLQNASGFMAHALHKLRDELQRQGAAT